MLELLYAALEPTGSDAQSFAGLLGIDQPRFGFASRVLWKPQGSFL
jgi:hypothetical protein